MVRNWCSASQWRSQARTYCHTSAGKHTIIDISTDSIVVDHESVTKQSWNRTAQNRYVSPHAGLRVTYAHRAKFAVGGLLCAKVKLPFKGMWRGTVRVVFANSEISGKEVCTNVVWLYTSCALTLVVSWLYATGALCLYFAQLHQTHTRPCSALPQKFEQSF